MVFEAHLISYADCLCVELYTHSMQIYALVADARQPREFAYLRSVFEGFVGEDVGQAGNVGMMGTVGCHAVPHHLHFQHGNGRAAKLVGDFFRLGVVDSVDGDDGRGDGQWRISRINSSFTVHDIMVVCRYARRIQERLLFRQR